MTIIEDFELEVLELVEERSKRARKRSSGGGNGRRGGDEDDDDEQSHLHLNGVRAFSSTSSSTTSTSLGTARLREKVIEGWTSRIPTHNNNIGAKVGGGGNNIKGGAAGINNSFQKKGRPSSSAPDLKPQRPASIYAKLFNLFTITQHETGESE